MTRFIEVTALLVLPLVLVAGCASAGNGGASSDYTENLGRQVYSTLREAMDKILLQQHGYRIQRSEEQYGSLLYETIWDERSPTTEERAEGVTRARHRIVIRGRRVGDDPTTGGALYRVTFVGENQAQTETSSSWSAAPVSQELRDEMREIVTDLNLELRTGVRR